MCLERLDCQSAHGLRHESRWRGAGIRLGAGFTVFKAHEVIA